MLTACDKPQADSHQEPVPAIAQAAEPGEQDIVVAQVGPEQITKRQLDQRLEVLDPKDRDFASTPSAILCKY